MANSSDDRAVALTEPAVDPIARDAALERVAFAQARGENMAEAQP